MGTVMKAVNRAYDRTETRPFWRLRLLAILLVVVTGLVLAGLFIFIVFGGPLGEAIADKAGLVAPSPCSGASFAGRLPSPCCFFFALVYYGAERRPPELEVGHARLPRRRSCLARLSGLFALYTSFADLRQDVRPLAGAIVLLLWLYYSAMALLFGAELNSELDRQADIHAAGGENAGP